MLDPVLRRALLDVPRHLFVPGPLVLAAYQDSPVPIGFDKTLSQPFIGALMLDLLAVKPGQRVLEVGAGLGYQAAVMAELGAEVFSVEVVEEFAELAQARFAALGYEVQVRVGDGLARVERARALRRGAGHRRRGRAAARTCSTNCARRGGW